MNPDWQHFLASQGAHIEDGEVRAYAGEPLDLSEQQGTTVLSDLSHFSLLHATGADTQTFLNGQLTSDVRELGEDQAQFSAHATPKGRVLSTFLLWPHMGGVAMLLPSTLCEALHKRLSMYVLRAQVKIANLDETSVRLGLSGPNAAAILHKIGAPVPATMRVLTTEFGTVLALAEDRFLLCLNAAKAVAYGKQLTEQAQLAASDAWGLLDIRAGHPWLTPQTSDAFIPQMLNLDLIGGISFKKGCYTGQEIVARTQYLGKLKKRLFRVQLPTWLAPGTDLYDPALGAQSCGTIIHAVTTGPKSAEALIVAQTSSTQTGIHVDSPTGPTLQILPLPYTLD